MQQKITNFLFLAWSLILTLGVKTFAGPCPLKDPNKIMSCQHAGTAVFYTGLFLCACALVKLLVKQYSKATDILAVLGSLACISYMGFTINLCASSRMHCQLVMRPFVIVLAVLILLVSVFDYWQQQK